MFLWFSSFFLRPFPSSPKGRPVGDLLSTAPLPGVACGPLRCEPWALESQHEATRHWQKGIAFKRKKGIANDKLTETKMKWATQILGRDKILSEINKITRQTMDGEMCMAASTWVTRTCELLPLNVGPLVSLFFCSVGNPPYTCR